MPADIRMLAVDLDGTVLGRGPISPRDVEALHRAQDVGIEVVVATGRSWVESREALKQLGLGGVMIAAGGAMLHEADSGQPLQRSVLEDDVIKSVACALLAEGHVVNLLQDSHAAGFDYWMVGTSPVDPATKWWFEQHRLDAKWVASLDQVAGFQHTVRVGTVAVGSQLTQVTRRLQEELADRVFIQHWEAVVESEASGEPAHLLEAFAPEVDKWTMLCKLAAQRGLEPRHIAAIGDGLNDIGMLQGARIGIVMAGAEPRVQAAADWSTGAMGGGVADAVERLLGSR